MAPTRPAILAQAREVIEIDSDNDSDDEVVEIPRPRPVRPVAHMPPQPLQPAFRERSALADEFMALCAKAEAEQDAQRRAEETQHRISIAPEPEVARSITVDECLAKVLEIYPDISHDHVRKMLRDGLEVGIQLDTTWCEQLIVRILDEGQYPTEREAKRAALKRKREPSENDFDRSPMRNGTSAVRRAYQSVATIVLQNEYPEIPVKFIDQTLREKASLFKAFLALEEAERTSSAMDASRRPYRKVRRRDPKPLPIIHEDTHSEAMESVQKELSAAQKKVAGDTAKRQREEQKRLEEEQNNAIALSNNEMVECPCCCDKFAANRMAFCNGEKVHFYCYECARRWVNEEMVQGKCYPKCFATVDCGAEISQAQLKAFLKPEEYKRLEMLQQWDAVNMAGIENFVRCPFCDFGAECEPVETDREFRCQNPNCRIVSCRLCEKETHTPKTCAEAEKDRKGSVRHRVEEAMTDALLRTCNKCKIKFLKLDGCNKMTCPKCGNAQCYVCGKNVNSYNHFHQSAGKCPLYDNNTEKRHQDEVKAAEAAALEVVRQQNPDMTEEELRIQFSDNVQQEEQKRVAAGERHRPLAHTGLTYRGVNTKGRPRRIYLVCGLPLPPWDNHGLHISMRVNSSCNSNASSSICSDFSNASNSTWSRFSNTSSSCSSKFINDSRCYRIYNAIKISIKLMVIDTARTTGLKSLSWTWTFQSILFVEFLINTASNHG
ncbi:Zinc finger C6HC-type protein [Botryosphaeria dothidea]|uniref:Zinc finger C6HC-type protein n=1 Tax=Botryosphaeria dothidea TaxID=55169 RepID=A0A8H4N0J0_9PEZI|nr:Zinc finger C6HC-type protein [Botryosphaeria dothidea]